MMTMRILSFLFLFSATQVLVQVEAWTTNPSPKVGGGGPFSKRHLEQRMVASNFYDPMYSLSSDDDNNNNNNSNSNNPRSTSLVENVQVALGLLKQVRMALDNLSQQPPQSDLKQQALKKELTTWWEAQSQPMTQTQSKKQTSESDHYEKELVQFLEQSESELYTVLDKVSKNEYTFQMAERDEEIAYQRTKKQLDQLEKDIVEGYASMRGMLTSLLPPEKR